MIDLKALAAPFPVEQVSWRVIGDRINGSAPAAAFLDARDVMDRLDAVCGADGWQCRYSHAGEKTVCDIGLRISKIYERKTVDGICYKETAGEWLWKADGAGDTAYEAEKGALSSAFKRAAVRWGIGRYLYHVRDPNTGKMPWVAVVANGNIPDHQLEYLYTLLPNNEGGLRQQTLPGQSKKEGAFWSRPTYSILDKMPQALKDAQGEPLWTDNEVKAWLYASLPQFITKAPSRLHLVKLQTDNLLWIKEKMDNDSIKSLSDMFVARATQFDQLKGGQNVKKD
jgi:hypothetical protein